MSHCYYMAAESGEIDERGNSMKWVIGNIGVMRAVELYGVAGCLLTWSGYGSGYFKMGLELVF